MQRVLGMLAALLLLVSRVGAARTPFEGASSVAVAAAALQPGPRQPPKLPESYSVSYTFTLPYTAHIQQDPISYPVTFHKDAVAGGVRMETYDGTNVVIAKKGRTIELVPRIDRQVCLTFEDSEDAEGSAVPDVAGWEFSGTEELSGEEADVWVYEARHEGKHVVYKFYTTPAGTPRRLHMHGNDMFSGAHFDEWVVDYTSYQPGRPEPSVFDTPELCKGKQVQEVTRTQRRGSQMRWAALLPAVKYRGGDAEYDAFLGSQGAARVHRSLLEYRQRLSLFQANQRLIQEHNGASKGYTLAMNRFGDYSQDEFEALLLPKKFQRRQQLAAMGPAAAAARQLAEAAEAQSEAAAVVAVAAAGKNQLEQRKQLLENKKLEKDELPYEPLADASRLPAVVTWRGTGADSVGVKDQATCGSCWSFAAAGAMEGAWWRATGQTVSFSEQQIVDCSWGYLPHNPAANLACDGGDPEAGIGHIVASGGIAETKDYQYKGQDGYCLANQTQRVGKFKGYVRVPRYDEAALREAVYSRGPIAISFDASRPSFRFFSSGVYYDTECKWHPNELDHSMLLTGYGTGLAGDYWEVKNSWSTHWGEAGYFRVARDNHACGTASDAVYAVVADDVAA